MECGAPEPGDGTAPFHGGAHGLADLLLPDAAGGLPAARTFCAVPAAEAAGARADSDLSRIYLLYPGLPDGIHGADVLRLVSPRLRAHDGRTALVVARPDRRRGHRGGPDQECHVCRLADAGRRLRGLGAFAGFARPLRLARPGSGGPPAVGHSPR